MSVPLRGGGRTLGVMTFVGAESGRRYVEADLDFAESLAARAAGAIENARLYRDADRFRRLLDATLDVVFVVDPESMRIVHANLGAAIATGIAAAALVDAPLASVLPDLDPSDLRGLAGPAATRGTDARTMTLALRGPRDPIPVEVVVQRVELPGGPDRLVAIARDISERIEVQVRLQRLAQAEHARAAELNAVIQRDGRGRRRVRRRWHDHAAQPGRRAALPRRRGAHLRRHPRPAPRSGRQRAGARRARRPGRDADPRGSRSLDRARDLPGHRRRRARDRRRRDDRGHARRDRGAPAGGRPRDVHRRPVARAADAGHDDLRWGEAAGRDARRRSTRRRRAASSATSTTRPSGSSGWSRTSSPSTASARRSGDIGWEPVLLQRLMPRVVESEEGRWPGVTFALDDRAGPADGHRRPDLRRTGRPQPAVQRREVRRYRLDGHARGRAGRGRGARPGPRRRARVPRRTRRPGCSSCSTGRRGRAASASGAGIGLFVCARLIARDGRADLGRAAASGGAEFGFALRVMADD